jgi:hypothetical protein
MTQYGVINVYKFSGYALLFALLVVGCVGKLYGYYGEGIFVSVQNYR